MGIDKRWYYHCKHSENQKSTSYKSIFSQALRKYGKECFSHDVLENDILTVDAANDAEQWWVAHFCSDDIRFGYNGTEGGLSYRKNEVHKQKLREARLRQPDPRLGTKHSTEARLKMSKAKLGRLRGPMSEEHRQKIAKANTGKIHSKETCRKIGLAQIGRKFSEETKKKMSIAKLGKPRGGGRYVEMQMGNLVKDKLTPISEFEAGCALHEAWYKIYDEYPTINSLALLWAQCALETGRWKSIHNFNWGNIKRSGNEDYCMYRCNEIINGNLEWFDPPHPQTFFRAYLTVTEGAYDYVKFLSQKLRYKTAWAAVIIGDPVAFSHSLKIAGYYTADEAQYTKGIVSLTREFESNIHEHPDSYELMLAGSLWRLSDEVASGVEGIDAIDEVVKS